MDSDENTWTLEQHAADVVLLARAMGFERYAVLGHSYGAFVTLQNAVDFPAQASQSIVSCGLPSVRWMEDLGGEARGVRAARPPGAGPALVGGRGVVQTPEDFARIMHDQMPWHFGDPRDSRIAEYLERAGGAEYSPADPAAVRQAATAGSSSRTGSARSAIRSSCWPGRHDRTCPPEAAELMAAGIPGAELRIFEQAAT
jgi:proline iminopeptidase